MRPEAHHRGFLITKELIMAKAPMKKEAPAAKGKFTFPPAKGAAKAPASKKAKC